MGLGNLVQGLPVVGGLFDDNEDKAKDIYDQILRQYQNLELPDIKWQNYKPEETQVMGDYTPESYQAQTLEEDPLMRGKQMDYLNQLQNLSTTGLAAEDQAAFEKAKSNAAQMARSGREAESARLKARGLSGSGMELAAREAANQEAASRAQSAGLDQAAASARQRALYNQAYGSELSSQKNQDMELQAKNKDILNKFNEMNTSGRNEAQKYNLANRQNIYGGNVANRNQAQQYNLEGSAGAREAAYKRQLEKMGLVSGAMGTQAQSYLAQAEANRNKRKALGQAVGTAIGAAYGGPEGAKIGGSIGGGIG